MKLNWRRTMMGLAMVGLIGMSLPSCVVRARGNARVVWVVDEEPPDPAPRYESRPAKSGYVWVQGNWQWQSNAWVWQVGHYERVKANHTWKAGYWEKRGNRWHWTAGMWVSGGGGGDVNVRDHRDGGGGGNDVNVRDHRKNGPSSAPGASNCAESGNSPGDTYVWLCGHWEWKNNGYAWKRGHWERQKADHYWKAGYWELENGEWTFHAGVWIKGNGQGDVRGVKVRDHRTKDAPPDPPAKNERVPAKRGGGK